MAEFSVDKDLIRALAALLEETGLSEIELEKDDQRVRVVRRSEAVRGETSASPPAAARDAPAPASPPSEDTNHPGAVTSPMVGTAFLGPEPGAAPYVTSGERVAEGQTLLIVEAMKTMNPIPAPRGGTVVDILVQDGAPIEYGEVLMIIE